jgi:hypothetical protein
VNGAAPGPAYFPVSTRKFVALSLLTAGIYELYWFYKCWQYVRARDGRKLRPFWRAFFSPLWLYPLQEDVTAHAPAGASPSLGSVPAAVLYGALCVAPWKLPDPYWLVSLLTFVPLLPLLGLVNASNPPGSAAFAENSAWRPRHLVLALLCGPLLVLAVGSSLVLLPPTQVIPGARLWAHDRAFLEAEGVVEPGEEILHFYSEAILSIRDEGALASDRAVVSYGAALEDGARWRERAAYDEIREVRSDPAGALDGWTTVTVVRTDGTEFSFDLSTEIDGHRRFVAELEERTRAARESE